jgi:hypothetical protein
VHTPIVLSRRRCMPRRRPRPPRAGARRAGVRSRGTSRLSCADWRRPGRSLGADRRRGSTAPHARTGCRSRPAADSRGRAQRQLDRRPARRTGA